MSDQTILSLLDYHAKILTESFNTDILAYVGDIYLTTVNRFRDTVEQTYMQSQLRGSGQHGITIVLTTGGGSAEAAEKMVEIVRHHYDSVNFAIPYMAMSAGTIFAMSGNRIYMDYSSSLGPIDPQILSTKQNKLVPALGYLDMIERIQKKSAEGEPLSEADIIMLQGQDLAELRLFEEARDLSIALLKKWLVAYKFSDWDTHSSNPSKAVTKEEKEKRAEEIAIELSDHKRWHSHGRMIGLKTLQELRLQIEDYSKRDEIKIPLRQYNDLLVQYARQHAGAQCIIHAQGRANNNDHNG